MTIPLIDQLIRARRRTIAILVQRDGKVVVRAPLKAPEALIRQFVESKAGWIREKKAEAAEIVRPAAKTFSEGENFLFLGREYSLSLVKGQRAALRFENGFFLEPKYLPDAQDVFEKWYRAAALQVLSGRAQFFAEKFGLRYTKIRISAARTRWGSCSTLGTLSFTWRLVMAPLEVVDYVVIHELAHLKVKNHSPRFWAEVARMLPDYRAHAAWLKKNGRGLSLGD